MKSIVRIIIVICLLIFNTAIVGANAPTINIETLSIKVNFLGKTPEKTVAKRVHDSVYVIAEQLLVGRTQAQINLDKIVYQNIIQEVADRVFTGYKVDNVDMAIDTESIISLTMSPWGGTLAAPKIHYEYTDVHPLFQPMLAERLLPLSAELNDVFADMPQESVYWLNSLAKDCTTEFSKRRLPEFRLLTQGYSQKDSSLEVVVIPVGEKIKSVDVQLISKNIPQSMLLWTKDYVTEVAAALSGLPVEFVLNNQIQINELLLNEINKYQAIKKYKLITGLSLKVNENSKLVINVDLANYNFWLKANLDLGKRDSNFSGVAHIGYDLTKSVELFTEGTLYTDTMNWDVDLGLSKRIVNTKFSYARRFGDTDNLFRIEHTFNPKWEARLEHRSKNRYNEFGVRYRFHDFVSAEYIISSKKSWLRIITNL